MERIEHQGTEERDLAKKILSWITCAKRRLTIQELLHAVAVENGLSYLDEDNLSDMQYVVSVCAGLVAVDEESGIIRLVHYTTQEYFERTWQIWFPRAHRDIAIASLTYLLFDQFATGPCGKWDEYRDRLQENPVYEYAARYWGYHAKEAYSEVKDLVDKLFQRRSTLASVAQVLSLERKFRSCIPLAHKGISGLHIAAWFGINDKVKELLKESQSHNAADKKGRTALHWASRNAQAQTVDLLIQEGADANATDKRGMTALHYAALQGDNHLIQLLVKNGAHLEVVDERGLTPFLTAADCVKIESVQEFLFYDTAINAVNPEHQNALHLAILASKDAAPQLVGMLLSHGVCPTLCDVKNMTPVHYAVAIRNLEIMQLFIEAGVDINFGIERQRWRETTKAGQSFYVLDQPSERTSADSRDAVGLTPLHFAAYTGYRIMIEYLLSKGADPNACCCSDGDTPLHIAIRRGLLNTEYEGDPWTDITWMVEAEFTDVDETESDRENSQWQIDSERWGVIDMLLASMKIDVNIQNVHLESSLHCVRYGGSHSDTIVAKLLQKGADPLKSDRKGQTALHLACEANDLEAIDHILDAGGSTTIEDAEGLTALHYSVRAHRYESAKLILDRHKETATSLCLATDKKGRTPLQHHLQFNRYPQVDIITLLLHHGANMNHTDLEGNSPLSIYLQTPTFEDRTAITRFLLEQGADPLWKNSDGQTLAHVTMNNYEAEVGVLELLDSHGVDLSMKDKQARSFLHYGAIYGSLHDEVIPFLLRNKFDGIDERDLENKSPLMHAEATEAVKEKRRRTGKYHSPRWTRSWKILKQMENNKLVQCDNRDEHAVSVGIEELN